MKYHDIYARSFSQHDRKRFGYGALTNCLAIVCCFFVVFKSYPGPPYSQLRLMILEELKSVIVTNTITVRPYVETNERKLVCNTMKRRSDTCEMTGDIRIHGSSSTIFVSTSNGVNSSLTLKPYSRKGDKHAMQNITNYTIKTIQQKSDETMPKCTKTHNVPAVVFSVGGYSGNTFHAFSDTIIPLYATSKRFNREVRFLVANKNPRWIGKFQELLEKLSKYETIDIDHENEVHCFSSMIIGLEKDDYKELNTGSMKDFTKFLRSSYSLTRSSTIKLTNGPTKRRPRLLIVSRVKTRAFTNVKDVVTTARDMGFEVVVTEMNANLKETSRLVNSCDVIMGVHGAGLTNMVFMPENGVVIQVVPLGNMGWMAKTFYGDPAKGMGLNYLEYDIREVESTLIYQYPVNHTVFKDPYSIQRKGWEAYRSVYMDKQDVTLDVVRFKETLLKALELLH